MNYVTIARVVNNGKRLGFVLKSIDGVEFICSDDKIKTLIDNGNILDIEYNQRGVMFKERGKKIGSLPAVEEKSFKRSKLKTNKKYNGITIFSGSELKEVVCNKEILKLNHRKFVDRVYRYAEQGIQRVVALSGLRGTGKTTGIYQVINKLGKFNETVLINIEATANIGCTELLELLDTKCSNAKFIFIDEVTRIKNFVSESSFLADKLCVKGIFVLISGTDSLALSEVKWKALYHRLKSINITHISYEDALNTSGLSLQAYIISGGLYGSDVIRNKEAVKGYVNTAIIDNIENTLAKNSNIGEFEQLRKYSTDNIRTAVFKILYAVVYKTIQRDKGISIARIMNLYEYEHCSDREDVLEVVLDSLGVNKNFIMPQSDMRRVLEILERIGILVDIENLYDTSQKAYYITNPCLNTQLVVSLKRAIEHCKGIKAVSKSLKALEGMLFEAVIVTHTKLAVDTLGLELYYYRDSQNRELDMVVEFETADSLSILRNTYAYYEIKMSNDSDIVVVNSRWLNDENITPCGDVYKVIERAIIYNGESKVFDKFNNSKIESHGLPLPEIEKQNKGIKLINVKEYLLDVINKFARVYKKEIDYGKNKFT